MKAQVLIGQINAMSPEEQIALAQRNPPLIQAVEEARNGSNGKLIAYLKE